MTKKRKRKRVDFKGPKEEHELVLKMRYLIGLEIMGDFDKRSPTWASDVYEASVLLLDEFDEDEVLNMSLEDLIVRLKDRAKAVSDLANNVSEDPVAFEEYFGDQD